MECCGRSALACIDPLVNSGADAKRLHTIAGDPVSLHILQLPYSRTREIGFSAEPPKRGARLEILKEGMPNSLSYGLLQGLHLLRAHKLRLHLLRCDPGQVCLLDSITLLQERCRWVVYFGQPGWWYVLMGGQRKISARSA